MERMREEVEQKRGEAKVFFTKKRAKNFKEILTKKGIIGERGFKEIMPPFKEEIEKIGWGKICKHLGEGRIALVIEFFLLTSEIGNT